MSIWSYFAILWLSAFIILLLWLYFASNLAKEERKEADEMEFWKIVGEDEDDARD